MKKLDKDTMAAVFEAQNALTEAIEEAQSFYDEKSEKWQQSDAGTNYGAWIEQLEQAISALENLPDFPGDDL